MKFKGAIISSDGEEIWWQTKLTYKTIKSIEPLNGELVIKGTDQNGKEIEEVMHIAGEKKDEVDKEAVREEDK